MGREEKAPERKKYDACKDPKEGRVVMVLGWGGWVCKPEAEKVPIVELWRNWQVRLEVQG